MKKAHELVAQWKGDQHFPEIAKRAAALKKVGARDTDILAAITTEFGTAPQYALLHATPRPYHVYGAVGTDIEPGALAQLETALRLPIAVKGALMPDAHPGYALPIGGVFAAYRAVAPAMVGVDIGCRMHLSVFADSPVEFMRRRMPLLDDLRKSTYFGVGVARDNHMEHAVLEDERWALTRQLAGLRKKADEQLGTSGAGNHFAELVIGERLDPAAALPAQFSGLLTHSGSRGVGMAIAKHYMQLAARETARLARVPAMYEWLSVNGEAGQEYWQAMELAGAFAQANHELIHKLFRRRTGLAPVATIENHHNMAWREGDLVIHRKGATPAEAGVLGLIPGSMGTASYIVVGHGNSESLNSASHGAGRTGSRKAARDSISLHDVRRFLAERDIVVEGLSVDESPMAYKDIERVLAIQVEAGLIRPLARMRPIAVIMAGEKGEG